MYSIESEQPKISRTKLDGLRALFYGMSGDEKDDILREHEVADVMHAAVWRVLLQKEVAPKDEDLSVEASGVSLGAQNTILDSVMAITSHPLSERSRSAAHLWDIRPITARPSIRAGGDWPGGWHSPNTLIIRLSPYFFDHPPRHGQRIHREPAPRLPHRRDGRRERLPQRVILDMRLVRDLGRRCERKDRRDGRLSRGEAPSL